MALFRRERGLSPAADLSLFMAFFGKPDIYTKMPLSIQENGDITENYLV